MRTKLHSSGFTIIELLIVVVIIGILSTLVITTYSGVQAKNRNSDRQASIDTIQGQLETYYVQYSKYPTLDNLNDAVWRQANLKNLPAASLQDPHWSSKNTGCTASNKSIVTTKPATDCFAYQVTSADGSTCDNKATACSQYTLTAMLEGGGKYVKSSLN